MIEEFRNWNDRKRCHAWGRLGYAFHSRTYTLIFSLTLCYLSCFPRWYFAFVVLALRFSWHAVKPGVCHAICLYSTYLSRFLHSGFLSLCSVLSSLCFQTKAISVPLLIHSLRQLTSIPIQSSGKQFIIA